MTKKRNVKKIVLITCVIGILVATLGFYFVGDYFVSYALERKPVDLEDPLSPTYEKSQLELDNIKKADEKILKWQSEAIYKEININTFDNLNLYAKVYDQGADDWVVLVHGYTSNHNNMLNFAVEYYEKGYNVLLPDLRAHGNSEGEYMGMGLYDSLDVISFIDYIVENDPQAKVILHGVSMGAATVMMAAGRDELSENVIAVIEDSGYTNAYQMMVEQLDARFGLPAFPVMNSAYLVGKIKAGYSLRDADAQAMLKDATVPILFIHGEQDTFVLQYMQDILYESYNGQKEKLTIKGADHVASCYIEPDTYYNTVFNFIDKYR